MSAARDVLVIGQKDDGPILQRIVKPSEFVKMWGVAAPHLFRGVEVVQNGHRYRVAAKWVE